MISPPSYHQPSPPFFYTPNPVISSYLFLSDEASPPVCRSAAALIETLVDETTSINDFNCFIRKAKLYVITHNVSFEECGYISDQNSPAQILAALNQLSDLRSVFEEDNQKVDVTDSVDLERESVPIPHETSEIGNGFGVLGNPQENQIEVMGSLVEQTLASPEDVKFDGEICLGSPFPRFENGFTQKVNLSPNPLVDINPELKLSNPDSENNFCVVLDDDVINLSPISSVDVTTEFRCLTPEIVDLKVLSEVVCITASVNYDLVLQKFIAYSLDAGTSIVNTGLGFGMVAQIDFGCAISQVPNLWLISSVDVTTELICFNLDVVDNCVVLKVLPGVVCIIASMDSELLFQIFVAQIIFGCVRFTNDYVSAAFMGDLVPSDNLLLDLISGILGEAGFIFDCGGTDSLCSPVGASLQLDYSDSRLSAAQSLICSNSFSVGVHQFELWSSMQLEDAFGDLISDVAGGVQPISNRWVCNDSHWFHSTTTLMQCHKSGQFAKIQPTALCKSVVNNWTIIRFIPVFNEWIAPSLAGKFIVVVKLAEPPDLAVAFGLIEWNGGALTPGFNSLGLTPAFTISVRGLVVYESNFCGLVAVGAPKFFRADQNQLRKSPLKLQISGFGLMDCDGIQTLVPTSSEENVLDIIFIHTLNVHMRKVFSLISHLLNAHTAGCFSTAIVVGFVLVDGGVFPSSTPAATTGFYNVLSAIWEAKLESQFACATALLQIADGKRGLLVLLVYYLSCVILGCQRAVFLGSSQTVHTQTFLRLLSPACADFKLQKSSVLEFQHRWGNGFEWATTQQTTGVVFTAFCSCIKAAVSILWGCNGPFSCLLQCHPFTTKFDIGLQIAKQVGADTTWACGLKPAWAVGSVPPDGAVSDIQLISQISEAQIASFFAAVTADFGCKMIDNVLRSAHLVHAATATWNEALDMWAVLAVLRREQMNGAVPGACWFINQVCKASFSSLVNADPCNDADLRAAQLTQPAATYVCEPVKAAMDPVLVQHDLCQAGRFIFVTAPALHKEQPPDHLF